MHGLNRVNGSHGFDEDWLFIMKFSMTVIRINRRFPQKNLKVLLKRVISMFTLYFNFERCFGLKIFGAMNRSFYG